MAKSSAAPAQPEVKLVCGNGHKINDKHIADFARACTPKEVNTLANSGNSAYLARELLATRKRLAEVTDAAQPGLCTKHQPNPALAYAGCWVCSREEETALLEEVLKSLGWVHDTEAEENSGGSWWVRYGEEMSAEPTSEAVMQALNDYDALRAAHKAANLYGAKQKAAHQALYEALSALYAGVSDAQRKLVGNPEVHPETLFHLPVMWASIEKTAAALALADAAQGEK